MIFGVGNDGYADAEAGGRGALGDGIGGVVSAFGVDIGAQFFQKLFNVWFGENYDIVDAAKSGDEEGAGLFVENGAARALEGTDAGVGIDGYDEEPAFRFGACEIAGAADAA